jgi:hypothetical protein
MVPRSSGSASAALGGGSTQLVLPSGGGWGPAAPAPLGQRRLAPDGSAPASLAAVGSPPGCASSGGSSWAGSSSPLAAAPAALAAGGGVLSAAGSPTSAPAAGAGAAAAAAGAPLLAEEPPALADYSELPEECWVDVLSRVGVRELCCAARVNTYAAWARVRACGCVGVCTLCVWAWACRATTELRNVAAARPAAALGADRRCCLRPALPWRGATRPAQGAALPHGALVPVEARVRAPVWHAAPG